MKSFSVEPLVRPHLLNLKPYASARSEFSGKAQAWLDANENAYGTPGRTIENAFHRYPDPYQLKLKEQISEIKNVPTDHIFLGNGSDEAIDLLIKVFCRPGLDNIVSLPPTFGMYEVAASINDVEVKSASLTADYQIDRAAVKEAVNENTKIIFFCSPNNPTGNLLATEDILFFLKSFSSLVVVDEAYVDFTDQSSFVDRLADYPNLVVLQTFSKAWGMAALRLGAAFTSPDVLKFLNKVKMPYNVSTLTQQTALEILQNTEQYHSYITAIKEQRNWLITQLQSLETVEKIYPSDANFFLATFADAPDLYQFLVDQGVIVRNRSSVRLCESGLRITVGTEQENQLLVETLRQYQPKSILND
ncbi:histidinol-phosphate transaminase [Tunicatimonas pelagia]|uniref:histidinol-phosphate transaminase n=1 Tax=Tunicatimonas pelagia TaxID=931531 RepID=UPI0026656E97|nr:histidinol-phosphate transaminase [Tunicatimonas pelagia]WKN43138.1 histidinol-phosphate transaminase [Tunicatimonas pelagia]